MTPLDRSQTIATIVLDHPVCARVFQQNRLDFCCRGHVTVEVACAEKGLDAGRVFEELEVAIRERAGEGAEEDPRALETAALIDRITFRHHAYLRKTLPYLVPLATKVARVHGSKEERLVAIRDLVMELHDELIPHLGQEEAVLFPALVAKATDAALIESELAAMDEDHLAVGRTLERLRRLTDDFAAPAWACNSYRTLFAELGALESDVLRHVHLENHVLAPRFARA